MLQQNNLKAATEVHRGLLLADKSNEWEIVKILAPHY